MFLRLLLLIVACLAFQGCAIEEPPSTPYAYGVRPTDWVMEDASLKCAQTCHAVSGDQRMLCMAKCPGFVTANVSTCADVPEWRECNVAYAASPRRKYRPSNNTSNSQPRHRDPSVGEQIAVGTVRVLGAIIGAALQAESKSKGAKKRRRSGNSYKKKRGKKKTVGNHRKRSSKKRRRRIR